MSPQEFLATATDPFSRLSARIEAWRNDPRKSKQMPEELWKAAVELSKEYSVYYISKTLRINYKNLKKRVKPQIKKSLPIVKDYRPHFIELGIEKPSSEPECTIEMEDGSGAKMKIHLRGATDLDLYELSRAFWGKQS
jgi:hypothetical protein